MQVEDGSDGAEVDEHPGHIHGGCERRRGNDGRVEPDGAREDRQEGTEHGGGEDLHGDGRPWLRILNPATCAKTFPGFFQVLEAIRNRS